MRVHWLVVIGTAVVAFALGYVYREFALEMEPVVKEGNEGRRREKRTQFQAAFWVVASAVLVAAMYFIPADWQSLARLWETVQIYTMGLLGLLVLAATFTAGGWVFDRIWPPVNRRSG